MATAKKNAAKKKKNRGSTDPSPAKAYKVTLKFFIRPTDLTGRFPNLDPDSLRKEEDVGIEVPAALTQLVRSQRTVYVPNEVGVEKSAPYLKQVMLDVFQAGPAAEEEITLGDGVLSWNPKGGPPWEPKPPVAGTPCYVFPVKFGGIDEQPGEGRHSDGEAYSYKYRWFVVGRFDSP